MTTLSTIKATIHITLMQSVAEKMSDELYVGLWVGRAGRLEAQRAAVYPEAGLTISPWAVNRDVVCIGRTAVELATRLRHLDHPCLGQEQPHGHGRCRACAVASTS